MCTTESGSKPLRFNWYKNGSPIVSHSTIRIENLSTSSVLIIDPISSINDNGNYSCLVTNGFGKDSSSIQVAIEGKLNQIFVFFLLHIIVNLNGLFLIKYNQVHLNG